MRVQLFPAVLLLGFLGASAPVTPVATLSFPGCNYSFRMQFQGAVANGDGVRDVAFEQKLFRDPYVGFVTFRSEPIAVQSITDTLDFTSTVLIDFSEPPLGAHYTQLVQENGPFGVCKFEVSVREVETDSVLVHDLIHDDILLKGGIPSPLTGHARLNLGSWVGRQVRLEVSGVAVSTYGTRIRYSAAALSREPDGDNPR